MFSWLWGCMVLSLKVAIGGLCWAGVAILLILIFGGILYLITQ